MDNKRLTGFDSPQLLDSFTDDVDAGMAFIAKHLGVEVRDIPKGTSLTIPSPGSFLIELPKEHLCEWSAEPMNLASPYGEGNHHRISWRRNWDVDREALTATHKPTGFVLAFTPFPEGGYTALPGCELPPFGPDGTLAMAQMFGLRELLKDGWEIFHTVMRKP